MYGPRLAKRSTLKELPRSSGMPSHSPCTGAPEVRGHLRCFYAWGRTNDDENRRPGLWRSPLRGRGSGGNTFLRRRRSLSPAFTRASTLAGEGASRRDVMVPFDQILATCETLIKRWHKKNDGQINIGLTYPVHEVHTPLSDQQLDDLKIRTRRLR